MTKYFTPAPGWPKKDPVSLPAKPTNGRPNLRVENLDRLIFDQGVRVKVYRTIFCPNVKSIDGAEHDIDCPLCYGEGFLDRYAMSCYAFIQGQTRDPQHNSEGIYDGNNVQATFQMGIELQYFTLVELVDYTEQFYERVRRQDGKVDVLRYPGVKINLLLDQYGKEWYEGTDFILDQNGNVAWCSNKSPDPGTIFSINYDTRVRFRALKAMHSNRFAQVATKGSTEMLKMPEQWLLAKAYLVTRKDKFTQEVMQNQINSTDDDSEKITE